MEISNFSPFKPVWNLVWKSKNTSLPELGFPRLAIGNCHSVVATLSALRLSAVVFYIPFPGWICTFSAEGGSVDKGLPVVAPSGILTAYKPTETSLYYT